MLEKIITGGQTGVGRAALDAALEAGFPCGGWCPEGREAEDGPIPGRYPLRALAGAGCHERTLRNLAEACGTAILYFGELEGGTETAAYFCMKQGRPYRLVDGDEIRPGRAAALLADFIADRGVRVLNVAGPRASRKPQAYGYAHEVVARLLRRLRR